MAKILVGKIASAHGIRGEVKLLSFTSDPQAIASYGPLATARGDRVEIARLKPAKDCFIAALKGVTDRTRAESLRGSELFIDRAALPDAEAGEVYAHDLIGAAVFLAGGASLGEIIDVPNYGAGDLLEVRVAGRRDTVLIPYAGTYVVDEAPGRVTVDLPEGYLENEQRL